MNRRTVVRIQIGFLVVLVLLVVGRTMWNTHQAGEREILLDDISAFELHSIDFSVEDTMAVTVSAIGSSHSRRDDDVEMAAYAWILDASSREPVWVMERTFAIRMTGTVVEVDTVLSLMPGEYMAYFSSYGKQIGPARRGSFLSRLFDDREQWANDSRRWRLSLRSEEGAATGFRMNDVDARRRGAVWTTGPLGNRIDMEHVWEVTQPMEVTVVAVGEIDADGTRRDYGWIVDAITQDTLWSMSSENTVWAGGAAENRMARETLNLPPGLYRFGFQTDNRHANDAWRANPPFDPEAWGMALLPLAEGDADLMGPYTPFARAEPAIALLGIGNDADTTARFSITDTLLVAIEAHGEIGRRRHDYGWLADDSGRRIWEMTEDRTIEAGGHRSNRREVAILELEPGIYELRYTSDGSHAYDSWRHDPPDHPERWGIALFPFDDAERVSIEPLADATADRAEDRPLDETDDEARLQVATDEANASTLVDLTRLGNDRREAKEFVLDETGDVFVQAVGEITLNNRYDYGWIEDVNSGERVWEMTFENTISAGGAGRNRIYEGVLKLPAGQYRVHFQTDFSHAYGDFASGEAPDEPSAWGIVVRRF
jgi:hypothetical protein